MKNSNGKLKKIVLKALSTSRFKISVLLLSFALLVTSTVAWFAVSFNLMGEKMTIGYLSMNVGVQQAVSSTAVTDVQTASLNTGDYSGIGYRSYNMDLQNSVRDDVTSFYFSIENVGQTTIDAYVQFNFNNLAAYQDYMSSYKYVIKDVSQSMAGLTAEQRVDFILSDSTAVTQSAVLSDNAAKDFAELEVLNKFGSVASSASGSHTQYFRIDVAAVNAVDSVKNLDMTAIVYGKKSMTVPEYIPDETYVIANEAQLNNYLNNNVYYGKTFSFSGSVSISENVTFKYPVNIVLEPYARLTINGDLNFDYAYTGTNTFTMRSNSAVYILGNLNLDVPSTTFKFIGGANETIYLGDHDGEAIDGNFYANTFRSVTGEDASQDGLVIENVNIKKQTGIGVYTACELTLDSNSSLYLSKSSSLRMVNAVDGASYIYVYNYGKIEQINFSMMAKSSRRATVYDAARGQEQIYIENVGELGTSRNEPVIVLPGWSTSYKHSPEKTLGTTMSTDDCDTYVYYRIGWTEFASYTEGLNNVNIETRISRASGSGNFEYTDVVYEEIPENIEYLTEAKTINGITYQRGIRINVLTAEDDYYALLGNYYNQNNNGFNSFAEFIASVRYVEIKTFNGTKITNAATDERLGNLISTLSSAQAYDFTGAEFLNDFFPNMFYEVDVRYVALPTAITAIEEYAFYGTSISLMTLPENVTSVGEYAFDEISTSNGYNGNLFVTVKRNTNASVSEFTNLLSGFSVQNTYVFTNAVTVFRSSVATSNEWYSHVYEEAVLATIRGVSTSNSALFVSTAGTIAKVVLLWGEDFSREATTISAIPGTVNYGGRTYTVTSVGEMAYMHVNGAHINYVSAPTGLRLIDKGAFSSLSIDTVLLNNVTRLGDRAFADSAVASLNLGAVDTIGNSAFAGADISAISRTGAINLQMLSLGERAFDSATIRGGELDLSGDYTPGNAAFVNATFNNATLKLRGISLLSSAMLNGITLEYTDLDLQNVFSIGANAFAASNGVTVTTTTSNRIDVNLKNVISYGENIFNGASRLYFNSLTVGIDSTLYEQYAYNGYSVPDAGILGASGQVSVNELRLDGIFGDKTQAGATVPTILRCGTSLNVELLTITANCAYLADYAFAGNANTLEISDINVAGTLQGFIIGDYAFYATSAIPEKPTSFGGDAIDVLIVANTGLLAATDSIGASAFENVRFASSSNSAWVITVDTIGARAFANCINRSAATLELSGVASIGNYAFTASSFSKLNSLSIINSYVGAYAFADATLQNTSATPSASSVFIIVNAEAEFVGGGESIATVSQHAFENVSVNVLSFTGLTGVGAYCFAQSEIAELRLNDLKQIGTYAFSGAEIAYVKAREGLQIGSMTALGAYAFNGAVINGGTLDLSGEEAYSMGDGAFNGLSITGGALNVNGVAEISASHTQNMTLNGSSLYMDNVVKIGDRALSTDNNVYITGSGYTISMVNVLQYGTGIFYTTASASSSQLNINELRIGVRASYYAENEGRYVMSSTGLFDTQVNINVTTLVLDGDFRNQSVTVSGDTITTETILRPSGGNLTIGRLEITANTTGFAQAMFAQGGSNGTITINDIVADEGIATGFRISDYACYVSTTGKMNFGENAAIGLGSLFEKTTGIGKYAFYRNNFTKTSAGTVDCVWALNPNNTIGEYAFAYAVNSVTTQILMTSNVADAEKGTAGGIGDLAFYASTLSSLAKLDISGILNVGRDVFWNVRLNNCEVYAFNVPYMREGAFEFAAGTVLAKCVLGISKQRLDGLEITIEDCYYGNADTTAYVSYTSSGNMVNAGGLFSQEANYLDEAGLSGTLTINSLELQYSLPGSTSGIFSSDLKNTSDKNNLHYDDNFRPLLGPVFLESDYVFRDHVFNTLVVGAQCYQIPALAFYNTFSSATVGAGAVRHMKFNSLDNKATSCAVGDSAFLFSEWDDNTTVDLSNWTFGTRVFFCSRNITKIILANNGDLVSTSATNGLLYSTNLQHVEIGDGVNSIGNYVFSAGSSEFVTVTILNTENKIEVTGGAFSTGTVGEYSDDGVTLYVPVLLYSEYNSDRNWSNFFDVEFNYNLYATPQHLWYYVFANEAHTQVEIAYYQRVTNNGSTLSIPAYLGDNNEYEVVKINDGAFSDATYITTLNIPQTVKAIGVSAITVSTITSVNIDSKNPYFCTDGSRSSGNWVLMSKDKTVLYFYFAQNVNNNNQYVIPYTVRAIMPDAFINATIYRFYITSSFVPIISNETDTTFGELFTPAATSSNEVYYGINGSRAIYVPNGMQADYQSSYYFKDIYNALVFTATQFHNSAGKTIYISGDWAYSLNGGSATIEGYIGNGGSVTVPLRLNNYYVTAIGDYALTGNENIGSVNFESGSRVASVGNGAFYNSSIKSIDFTNATLLTVIWDNAFANCMRLTSFNVPYTVTTIGANAFYGAERLTDFTVTDTAATPSQLNSIGAYAFSGDIALLSITLPQSTQSLGEGLFSDCIGLQSVNYSTQLTSIPAYMFNDCASLSVINGGASGTVTLSINCLSVGDYAFNGCESITALNYEAGTNITQIGVYSFNNCSLSSLDLPDTINSLGNYAFANNKLTSVDLPDGVTAISDGLFYCNDLLASVNDSGTNLTLMNYTSIGAYAFYGCNAYTLLTVRVDVDTAKVTIGDYAFASCDSLQEVASGSCVTSVGEGAFKNCSSLSKFNDRYMTGGTTTYYDEYARMYNVAGIGTGNKSANLTLTASGDAYTTDISGSAKFMYGGTGSNSVRPNVTNQSVTIEGVSFTRRLRIPEILNNRSSVIRVIVNHDTTLDLYAASVNYTETLNVYATLSNNNFSDLVYSTSITTTSDKYSITLSEGTYYIGVAPASNYWAAWYFYGVVDNWKIPYTATDPFVESTGNGFKMFEMMSDIPDYLFSGCVSLAEINLDNIENVGAYAFENIGITTVELSSDINVIGDGAFYNNKRLKSVTVAANGSIISIGEYAFAYPSAAERVAAGEYVPTGELDDAAIIEVNERFNALQMVEFNNRVWSIGGYCFANCANLDYCNLANTVTVVPRYCFINCSGLVFFALPTGCTTVETYAFNSCVNMQGIWFPSTIRVLGEYAFTYCSHENFRGYIQSGVNWYYLVRGTGGYTNVRGNQSLNENSSVTITNSSFINNYVNPYRPII